MCGAYTVFTDAEYTEMRNIIEEISRKHNTDVNTGDIYPKALIAAIANTATSGISPCPLIWGFPKEKSKSIINARAETADTLFSFSQPFQQRRCIIPSTGFYEWKAKEESGKVQKMRYWIRKPEEKILYMAGLWDTFDGPNNPVYACVIITMPATESTRPIHHRMPLILAKDEISLWITDRAFAREALRRPGPELLASPA